MNEDRKTWDVFISYASEDRDAVAAPLAQLLAHLGLSVWFDQIELKVGDSLRERIDDGLSRSRYGAVILSKAFFGKHWPTQELNGLAQCEVEGRKVILPVWHEIDEKTVRSFSPPLADRVALPWTKGLYVVAHDLIAIIRPDIAQTLRERANRIVTLLPIRSGRALADLIAGSYMLQCFNEAAQSREEAEELAAFLQQAQDWGDIWGDLELAGQVEAEFSMHESLTTLLSAGWTVHGHRAERKVKAAGAVSIFSVALLAVVRGSPPAVFVDGNQAIVPRAIVPTQV